MSKQEAAPQQRTYAPDDAVDQETRRRVRNFLHYEAEILDDRELREWLDLMAEDLEYRVPVRVSQEGMDSDFINMHHIKDSLYTLRARIDRLDTEYAWAERPPSRYRHHISNIRVKQGDADDELAVKSNVLVYISEGDEPDYTVLSGERQDTLRRVDGELRLVERIVYLDNTTLPLGKISVFI